MSCEIWISSFRRWNESYAAVIHSQDMHMLHSFLRTILLYDLLLHQRKLHSNSLIRHCSPFSFAKSGSIHALPLCGWWNITFFIFNFLSIVFFSLSQFRLLLHSDHLPAAIVLSRIIVIFSVQLIICENFKRWFDDILWTRRVNVIFNIVSTNLFEKDNVRNYVHAVCVNWRFYFATKIHRLAFVFGWNPKHLLTLSIFLAGDSNNCCNRSFALTSLFLPLFFAVQLKCTGGLFFILQILSSGSVQNGKVS